MPWSNCLQDIKIFVFNAYCPWIRINFDWIRNCFDLNLYFIVLLSINSCSILAEQRMTNCCLKSQLLRNAWYRIKQERQKRCSIFHDQLTAILKNAEITREKQKILTHMVWMKLSLIFLSESRPSQVWLLHLTVKLAWLIVSYNRKEGPHNFLIHI